MRCKWQEEIWFYNDDGFEDARFKWCEGDIITYVGVGDEVHAVIQHSGNKLLHRWVNMLTVM